ncbi:MAG: polysaccharide biosynthesis protein GtrA [Candidatus Magasanikbacteria bacterium CG10_big_fil_rev_8_21_14_0_10_36_32]|uniref:Polysaccharide biosynthesis protein GtrA n=1 Tax=Candidatus Magasanikbacteria bacterium CG10_big_fil_rev_8_21_14_0_10_36_32 TaxID=1974646 RepID=A0A2M6W5W0_9BACT|nr:MAG: polysaccharide biosynthesis protein GtrA [Candidatus Magasanikbacteria bacterium CG10_big_fil_rev_8_21_14_0_10_36_32]
MINLIKKILSYRYIRFLLVGFMNTVFGYGLYAFFIFIGLHYSVAALLGTVLGVLFNFQTIGRLVFGRSDSKFVFLRFVAVYALGYVLNVALIYVLKQVGFNDYLAGAVLILPVATLIYFLNSKFVFKLVAIEVKI